MSVLKYIILTCSFAKYLLDKKYVFIHKEEIVP